MSDRNGNVWKPIAIVSIVVALLLLCLLTALGCSTLAYFVAKRGDGPAQYRYGYGLQVPAPLVETPTPEPPQATEVPFWIESGATITYVEPDSPADRAGLVPGDVITAVDTQRLGQGADLADVIRQYKPGDTVTIEYTHWRSGREERVRVTLGEHPDDPSRPYLGIEYTMVPELGDD